MTYGFKEIVRNYFGKKNDPDLLREKEFYALKDINFQLKRGEVLGILGRNGSGKTTLVRLINGMYIPTAGRIKVNGIITSMFAVTAGLENLYTGRENIFLKGAMMGAGDQEIRDKFDEIIEFAELSEFIDAPLGTYSSGMKARLGFSIAYAFKPDILIIDEGLGVGDRPFKLKSLQKLKEISETCAVIMISHNMRHITRLANKIMILDKGNMLFQGDEVDQGIDMYYRHCFEGDTGARLKDVQDDEGGVQLLHFAIDKDKTSIGKSIDSGVHFINYQTALLIDMELEELDLKQYYLRVVMLNEYEQVEDSVDQLGHHDHKQVDGLHHKIHLHVPELCIQEGVYELELEVVTREGHQIIKRFENLTKFQVDIPKSGGHRKKTYGSWTLD